MIKRNFTIFLVIAISLFAVFATACSGEKLQTPDNILVDDDLILNWTLVDNASSYTVEVKNIEDNSVIENSTRRTYYSLTTLEEGDYEIRVRAVGNGNEYGTSDWTEALDFHKDFEVGCVFERINNNTEYAVKKVGTAKGDIVLPDVYRGKPVTRIQDAAFRSSGVINSVVLGKYITYIGDNAFYNCNKLTSVTIPETVTHIGKAAFQACAALKSISIPENISVISEYMFAYSGLTSFEFSENITEIQPYAFDGTSLASAELPSSLVTVGEYAFAEIKTLTEVSFGENLEYIGENAFRSDGALERVRFAEDSALTAVDVYAFAFCSKLSDIVLPEGLLSIGKGAFYETTALDDINIPDSVVEVGYGAFFNSKFYREFVASEEDYLIKDGWLLAIGSELFKTATRLAPEGEQITPDKDDNANKVIYYLPDTFKGVADQVFYGAKEIVQIKLPSSVRIIGAYSFSYIKNLWKFETMEQSLKVVGVGAFYGDGLLTSVVFGSGVETISASAFYKCERLANNEQHPEYLVPESVTSVGAYAFYGTELWETYDESGVAYAGTWAVGYEGIFSQEGGSVANITLKDGTTGIADFAFYGNTAVRTIAGMGSVKYLGTGAFMACESLGAVTMPQNLQEIGDYTFYKCSAIYDADIPSRVTRIGRSAFYGCTGLQKLDLSDTKVESIDAFAFYGTLNMLSADFGKNLKEIGRYAFYGSGLEAVTIPESVVSIGDCAFRDSYFLESVDIKANITEIERATFSGCGALKQVTIPDTVKTIGDYAFTANVSLQEVTLGSGVETIGDYAFFNAMSLEKISLPASLKSIGDYAFYGNTSLKTVNLGLNVTRIGQNAFYGCSDLTVYTEYTLAHDYWSGNWNSSFRPVLWGSALSEDKDYVVSVKLDNGSAANLFAVVGDGQEENEQFSVKFVANPPAREGYTFLGWSTAEGSAQAEYGLDDLVNVPAGTVLYAVWAAN